MKLQIGRIPVLFGMLSMTEVAFDAGDFGHSQTNNLEQRRILVGTISSIRK